MADIHNGLLIALNGRLERHWGTGRRTPTIQESHYGRRRPCCLVLDGSASDKKLSKTSPLASACGYFIEKLAFWDYHPADSLRTCCYISYLKIINFWRLIFWSFVTTWGIRGISMGTAVGAVASLSLLSQTLLGPPQRLPSVYCMLLKDCWFLCLKWKSMIY